MQIEHQATPGGGTFTLVDEGRVQGGLTYRRENETIVVTHTGVDQSLRGRGLGRRLVEAAIARGLLEGLHVVATCWYARQILERKASGVAAPSAP